MKANNSSFEAIPVAALSELTSGSALAVIINTTGESNIFKALSQLYCHSSYKVYYLEPGVSQLRKTLEFCEELKIRSVVLCGEELPATNTFIPDRNYSATLVSAGSEFNTTDILTHIISDKNAHSFSHVGYQLYRYNPFKLSEIRGRFFEEMRLGSLRGAVNNAEPLMRNSTHFLWICGVSDRQTFLTTAISSQTGCTGRRCASWPDTWVWDKGSYRCSFLDTFQRVSSALLVHSSPPRCFGTCLRQWQQASQKIPA